METSVRGFVLKIDIGRAGLVTVVLILADGSTASFVIEDLDADPERFNERLSKLAILRDAMDRAEPVEIEAVEGASGLSIDRVARLSRDALAPIRTIVQVTGLVLDLLVHAENAALASGERHDTAQVAVLTTDMAALGLTLDLQAPERLVAIQQLELLREAEVSGRLARFLVDQGAEGEQRRIVAVALDDDLSAFGSDRTTAIDGFVESLSLLQISSGELIGNFAHVRFTTAPPFTGAGNTVGVTPFTPVTIDLLTPKQSQTYALFEAGLRDNLRMRVQLVAPRQPDRDPDTGAPDRPAGGSASETATGVPRARLLVRSLTGNVRAVSTSAAHAKVGIALAAELLAPLASASRPVWITIARETLDRGPDGYACTPGVPTSDLTPMSLRDLRIPYPAVWTGMGCFNPGVYRFQLQLPSAYTLKVDGEELCLYDADSPGIKLAHACLGGEHTVTVEIDAWTCDNEFVMDVYRIR